MKFAMCGGQRRWMVRRTYTYNILKLMGCWYRGSPEENEMNSQNDTYCLMCNLTVGNCGMNVLVWLEFAEGYKKFTWNLHNNDNMVRLKCIVTV